MPGVGSRSFVAGHFSIELEGADAGFIQSVNGGAIRADVINQSPGPTSFVKKHMGPPKYEPFTIQIGLGMRSSIYDWIAASLKMNYIRKNGSIVSHDFKLQATGEREFFNALITDETAVPTWHDWFESFVVKGRNDETQEKRGALVFLSPNRLTELGRVTFYNLGIFRMAPAMAEPTADQRPRMTADLYCERMEYSMHMPSLDGVAG